jgi:hypothetical protein
MTLREVLGFVGRNYDRRAGMNSPAQLLLRSAPAELADMVAGGITIVGSGGKGNAAASPWIAFLDPDETASPQEGLYVVYLFATDLTTVALTVNQGVTFWRNQLGGRQAISRLGEEAAAIRAHMPEAETFGLASVIDLKRGGFLQTAYEAATVLGITYNLDRLPGESQLRRDLGRFMNLYQTAVATKRELLQASPGLVASPSTSQISDTADPLLHFLPKDDADYLAHLAGKTLVKTRRHETLVKQYGLASAGAGFAASTEEHPKDLVLRNTTEEWLVEAKVLYRGNATVAVRGAIGQLLCYRHFLYAGQPAPRLLALFSEPIGIAYVNCMESLGIASVWKSLDGWHGSEAALSGGLVPS